jgi:hypothetical protein
MFAYVFRKFDLELVAPRYVTSNSARLRTDEKSKVPHPISYPSETFSLLSFWDLM